MTVQTVPAATWAVFTISSPTGIDYVPAAYTRIVTEWLPSSQYERDESVPSLEVFHGGDADSPGINGRFGCLSKQVNSCVLLSK